jgi:hypothetical protein
MQKSWVNPILIIPLSLIVVLPASTASAQIFSPPKNVSNTPGGSGESRVAVDGRGNINVIWNDNTPGNLEIFFARSTDLGTTFSAPKNISHNTGASFSPQMAVDSAGNINVVWTDNTPGNDDIFFSRSSDGGTTFSTPLNLSHNGGNSFNTQIAVDSAGNINVVWEDDTLGNLEIFFARSTNGGVTFSAPLDISNNTGMSEIPEIAVDRAGHIDIAWQDNTLGNLDVLFARSNDGITFSTPQNLSNNSGASIFVQPAVDSSGNIYLVWEDTTPLNTGVLFSRSTDGGSTFSTPQNLLNGGIAQFPRIVVDTGGKIDVVWEDNAPGSFNIFFSRSSDGGITFSAPQNLSNNTDLAHLAQLAVDSNGNINVVWQEGSAIKADIFFSRSINDGTSFSTPENISNDLAGLSPQIAVDNVGNTNVVWNDSSPGNSEVFFSQFIVDDDTEFSQLSGGNTFTGNQTVNGTLTASSLVATGPTTLDGAVTIGGGTPIKEHLSQAFSLNVPALAPSVCAPVVTVTLTGASDGDSLVLGVANSLMAAGSGILNYAAWVSAANAVTIRVCNINPNGPKSSAVSGTIRVDLWQH